MKLRSILHTFAAGLPLALAACGSEQAAGDAAQAPANALQSTRADAPPAGATWEFVNEDELAKNFVRADSIVEEGNGGKVAWIRHSFSAPMNSEAGGQINIIEVQYRFDCPGKRMLHLATRERMDERLVSEKPARDGEAWQAPPGPLWGPTFARVCGTSL